MRDRENRSMQLKQDKQLKYCRLKKVLRRAGLLGRILSQGLFKKTLIVVLVICWVFSGWPQIFNFPPKTPAAYAADQYFTDFSEYTTGSLPSDWTRRWASDGTDWIVRADAGSSGGKSLFVEGDGASHRRMLSWNILDSASATVEMYWTFSLESTSNDCFGAARGSGSASSEQAYRIGYNQASRGYELAKYVSGSYTRISYGALSLSTGTWYKSRALVSGNNLKLRTWLATDSEPGTWNLEATDTSITTAGWIGLAAFYSTSGESNGARFGEYGVGLNGQPAPTAPLAPPDPPTNVSATDGTYTDKVTITWTKSDGATDYNVWRDTTDLGSAGDVATYDDTGAGAPTVTPGTASATDGSSTSQTTLSISGASANNGATHTYKVIASNANGDSDDSNTNTGYRGVGSLTYQWYRSSGDSDSGFSTLSGATSTPYNDTTAPAPTITPGAGDASDGTSPDYVSCSVSGQSANDGAGRYYYATVSATGASPADTTHNRGYRGVGSLTYQWQRSSADSDADYSDIIGGTTASYNDTGAPSDGSRRYFRVRENATGASEQISTANRGYRSSHSMTSIDIRAKNYTTAVSTITFPESAPSTSVTQPYNNIDTVSSPQTFGGAGTAEPVVTLYNDGIYTLTIWYNITTFTNGIVSNEYYLINTKGGACADADSISNSVTFDTDTSTAVTIAPGAGNEKDFYLKTTLSGLAAVSGTSTLTILGEAL